MKFRLKWTGLDYCMGYTKMLPKKIRKIKVTKIDNCICAREEPIPRARGAAAWKVANAECSPRRGPYVQHFVSAQSHPASRRCSDVLTWPDTQPQAAGAALLAGSGPQGLRESRACPRSLCAV